jgi:hypothetical protein
VVTIFCIYLCIINIIWTCALHYNLIYAVVWFHLSELIPLLLLWILVVVLPNQYPVVEGDDVIPQMLLSLISTATHTKKTDVVAEQE